MYVNGLLFIFRFGYFREGLIIPTLGCLIVLIVRTSACFTHWQWKQPPILKVTHLAPCANFNIELIQKRIFSLRDILLGPPHDVQREGVNPCRKFFLCLD